MHLIPLFRGKPARFTCFRHSKVKDAALADNPTTKRQGLHANRRPVRQKGGCPTRERRAGHR
ncbi:hypothetical protein EBBID32_25140 [Sphingobium indicum BiD32]|uniref:Uncharacterized protein n=1 Tax=Sphingobium indicum BiD32 TaxID=1301087 RepID=N1MRY4_9SPHN|nr:hypothetical protein EBBID32_25140 [Sphingobium indicum BiD32]